MELFEHAQGVARQLHRTTPVVLHVVTVGLLWPVQVRWKIQERPR
jgi:hypothetical protein